MASIGIEVNHRSKAAQVAEPVREVNLRSPVDKAFSENLSRLRIADMHEALPWLRRESSSNEAGKHVLLIDLSMLRAGSDPEKEKKGV